MKLGNLVHFDFLSFGWDLSLPFPPTPTSTLSRSFGIFSLSLVLFIYGNPWGFGILQASERFLQSGKLSSFSDDVFPLYFLSSLSATWICLMFICWVELPILFSYSCPFSFFFFYFLVKFAVLSSEFSSLYIVYVELLISKSFLFPWFILDSFSLWDIDYSSFWNSLLLPTLYLFFPSSFLFPPYFVLRAFLNFWYVAVWSYFMVKHWNTHWKLFGWSRLLTDRWTSLRVIGFCLFWRYLKWQFL